MHDGPVPIRSRAVAGVPRHAAGGAGEIAGRGCASACEGSRHSRRPWRLSMRGGFRSIGSAHAARRRGHRCSRVMATRTGTSTQPAPVPPAAAPIGSFRLQGGVLRTPVFRKACCQSFPCRAGMAAWWLRSRGRTTLACCLRRDALSACRAMHRGVAAGEVVETFLRQSCRGVRESLQRAQRMGPWLSVGPLWPGAHPAAGGAIFRVGNAAGESHPLIGEGISMALQSATLLAHELTRQSKAITARQCARICNAAMHAPGIRRFREGCGSPRCTHTLPCARTCASPARGISARWPALLGHAARLAGKTQSA